MTQKERLVDLLESSDYSELDAYFDNLANWLLSNGVIVPPCKVGDTVYILWPPNQDDAQIIQGEVIGFSVGMKDEVYISNINYCGCFCRPFSEVFVYREAAEQALEEMKTDE